MAVVVPSPAESFVLLATSLTSCAPIFSNLSLSSTSLATVTPSFVILGAPKDLSITTLRPLGPSVTLTASASLFTPVSNLALASDPKNIFFADIIYSSLVFLFLFTSSCYDTHNVRFFHYKVFFAVHFNFSSRPFSKKDFVSFFNIRWY